MTLHFVRLALGNKTYKAQVSTDGCSYVVDFKGAIKTKLPHLLAAYDSDQLTLFEPDGTTEIDPGETKAKLNGLKVGPLTPLVVIVEELPTPAPSGSGKIQLIYKGMSTEASFMPSRMNSFSATIVIQCTGNLRSASYLLQKKDKKVKHGTIAKIAAGSI
jgi:hypothetical protein